MKKLILFIFLIINPIFAITNTTNQIKLTNYIEVTNYIEITNYTYLTNFITNHENITNFYISTNLFSNYIIFTNHIETKLRSYYIQTGIFLNKKFAENLVKKLKTQHFDAYIINSYPYYRVCIGKNLSEQQAKKIINKLTIKAIIKKTE
ncbi:MAG: SPOR domain-containing protein [Brevinematales bacterium]|nr:SPOR domain-containing protein [Brevinematales bacterium]